MNSGINLRKVYDSSIMLTAFLIPSGLYQATLAVVAITLVSWVLLKEYKRVSANAISFSLLAAAGLYVFVIGGFFLAGDFSAGLSSLSKKLPFLLYPFLLAGTYRREDLLRKIHFWFTVSVILFLFSADIYALCRYFIFDTKQLMVSEGYYTVFKSFGLTSLYAGWHPTYVALFADHALLILLGNWLMPGTFLLKKWMKGVMIVFLTGNVFLLDSITAIIILLLILIIFIYRWFVKSRRKRLRYAYLIVFCLTGITAVVFFFRNNDKMNTLLERGLKITDREGDRNVLTIRLAKWETYGAIIKDYFWTGTTLGDLPAIRNRYYLAGGFDNLAKYRYNAHNEYLEFFAVFGVGGFLLFLFLLAYPFYKKEMTVYYPYFILICAICFLTESVLERQQGINYFMFFYAIYIVSFRKITPAS